MDACVNNIKEQWNQHFFSQFMLERELLFQVKLGHCQHKITDYIDVIFQQAGLCQKKK